MAADRTLVLLLEIGITIAVLLGAVAFIGVALLRRELGKVRLASRALGDGGLYGLDQLLREQGLHIRQVDERAAELERRLNHVDERLGSAIRHVHVLRFNPFRDTGGDQSFVIALLDDGGSGIVITGLQTRAEMRIFAKPLQGGSSTYTLSDEEIAAIRAAFAADESKAQP